MQGPAPCTGFSADVRRFSAMTTESAYVLVRKVGTIRCAPISISLIRGLQLISLSAWSFGPSPDRAGSNGDGAGLLRTEWELWADAPDRHRQTQTAGSALWCRSAQLRRRERRPWLRLSPLARVRRIADPIRTRSTTTSSRSAECDVLRREHQKVNVVVVVGTGLSASQNVLATRASLRQFGGIRRINRRRSTPARRADPEIRAVIVTEHALCLPGDSRGRLVARDARWSSAGALQRATPAYSGGLVDIESTTSFEDVAREVFSGGRTATRKPTKSACGLARGA